MKLHQSAGIPVIVCSQLATRQAGFVLSGLLLPASAFVPVFFLSCSVFVEPEVQNMRTYPGEEPEQTRSKLLSARLKPGGIDKSRQELYFVHYGKADRRNKNYRDH
jgi:hypothetical protein